MRTSTHTFDTYEFVKEFQKSDTKIKQAEAIAKALASSREFDLSQLATKDQLSMVEERLEGKINSVEERLAGKMDSMRSELLTQIHKEILSMTKWLMATMIGTAGICMTLAKFLFA